jgi:hypothetical protein
MSAPDSRSTVVIFPPTLMAILDEEADAWAEETNIAAWIAQLASDERTREKLDSIMRLCFVEGAYRGASRANQEHRRRAEEDGQP